MKKRVLFAAAALSLSLSLPALAAEDSTIQVQLNGQPLTFSDAVPQVREQRTFLPFRAVFEAMGAEVSSAGQVITATRGDTTLTLTIGSTEATVTTGETTRTLTMDVAPYVDSATWRTYVPVRFAASAFGCNVGWDQEALTAVIVDVEPLVESLFDANSYTILNQYLEYSKRCNEGNHAIDMTLTGVGQMMNTEVLTLDGSVTGITSGSTAAEMAAQVDLDMTGLQNLLSTLYGTTPEEMDATEDDCKLSLGMDLKMDLERGTYFFRYDDATTRQAGMPAGTWFSMNLSQLLGDSALDLSALTALDWEALVRTMATSYDLDGQAADGYSSLLSLLQTTTTLFRDESFQKTEAGYELPLSFSLPEGSFTGTLFLTCDTADSINGYRLDLDCTLPVDETTRATLAQAGLASDKIALSLSASMDESDQAAMTLTLGMGTLFQLDVDMAYTYTLTDTLPDTTLPAGAQVIEYEEYLKQAAIVQDTMESVPMM